MSFDAERSEIETEFVAQYGGGETISYNKQKLKHVDGVNSISIAIIHGEGFRKSLGAPGANLARYAGVARFRVYTPGGSGSKAGSDIAETIAGIFMSKKLSTVQCRVPYIQSQIEVAPFLETTLFVPYQRDVFTA